MTENEAIKILKRDLAIQTENKALPDGIKAIETAIQALEEIQQYRAIGTVEEVKELKDYKELYDVYRNIGSINEFRNLKNKKNVLPITNITINEEDMQKIVDEKIKEIELDIQKIRAKALDEFAEALKERLKGMQMVEFQGEDVCPCAETGEECTYINQDIGCQYCAREHTIQEVDEIAEQLKGEQL